MNRREFLEAIAVAAAAGLPVGSVSAQGAAAGASFYDGVKPFGIETASRRESELAQPSYPIRPSTGELAVAYSFRGIRPARCAR